MALNERLLTSDCRAETIDALKFEGSQVLESSFGVLGGVAMRGLMSSPEVQATFGTLSSYTDKNKMKLLARDAGIPESQLVK